MLVVIRVRLSVNSDPNPNLTLKLTTRFQSFLGSLVTTASQKSGYCVTTPLHLVPDSMQTLCKMAVRLTHFLRPSVCRAGILRKQTDLCKVAVQCYKVSFCRNYSSSVATKIRVNEVDLHYEKAGESSHSVLCLPGALGSTQSDFGPQLKSLCKDFTVVAFDPRGYGKSIPPKRDFPMDFFLRDANDGAELMASLGE